MTTGIKITDFDLSDKHDLKKFNDFKKLCSYDEIPIMEVPEYKDSIGIYVNQLDEVNAFSLLQEMN